MCSACLSLPLVDSRHEDQRTPIHGAEETSLASHLKIIVDNSCMAPEAAATLVTLKKVQIRFVRLRSASEKQRQSA